MENVILPELCDNLSDVLEDIFSDSECVTVTILWEKEKLCAQNSYSESQTSSEESDDSNDTSNARATTWVREDKSLNLGPFTGNPGVKQIPSDSTKVSEIIELFYGWNFLEMLSKETSLYYFQNQRKYDSNSKGLKCVDVSVAEMKKFLE
jgi:hypothetical protein